jgi:hypothetical protein
MKRDCGVVEKNGDGRQTWNAPEMDKWTHEPTTMGLCAQGIFIKKSRKLGIKVAFN